MRALPWLAAMLAVAGPASAQERPAISPTRDVDVTYRVPPLPGTGTARILEQRMRYDAAGNRQRVDPPTPGLYVIMDFTAHRMSTVRLAERVSLDMATPATAGVTASGAPFVRLGQARVADLDCTLWRTRDAAGGTADVCLTADGVLLRAVAAGRVLVEAASVRYEPQDSAVFAVPDGFQHVAAPTR